MARTLIYTSARKLLAAGRTGFGTVARSRKISALAAGAIERLSQFDRKRGSDTSRVIYAHRRTNVGNTSIHVLSAIRDAGADYTGRTNHIAHHLLIDPSEARNLAEKGITPADILANYEWLQSWNEAPRYYENEDDVDLLSLMSGRSGCSREQWKRLTGNAVHARLVASKQAAKSAVLVLPDAEAPLPLMAEALYELDSHSWDITFTTALEPSDSVGDFAWVITSASALPGVQDRCISRTVLHADQPDQLPVPEERPVKKPTIATREPAAQGAAQGLRPNHREPDIAAKNQTAADRVYGSTPLSQPIGHAGTTRHQPSSQPTHRKQSVPLAAIIGASAALLMAMVIVVMLLSKDRGGQTNLVADQKTEPAELTTEQKRLAEKIVTTSAISRIQANEAVRKFNEKDCEWWEKYLENLKKVCVSENPWSELEKWKMPKGNAPMPVRIDSAELQWMRYMVNSGEKKVFNDLVELAKKFKGKPLPQEHWDDFDKIARSYTGKKPFNEGELSNPFPKMAEELLKRQIVKSFDPEKEKEVKGLKQIFELGIWQNSSYENISHTVFLDLTRNAKNVAEWENFMKKYKKVRGQVNGGEMKSYLAIYKEYKKINDEWRAKGIDGKKNTGYKKLSSRLLNELKSKPDALAKYLKQKSDSSKVSKNDSISPQKKGNKVTEKYYIFHQDEEKRKTDLFKNFTDQSEMGDGVIDESWSISINESKATYYNKNADYVKIGSGYKFEKPNCKLSTDGCIKSVELDEKNTNPISITVKNGNNIEKIIILNPKAKSNQKTHVLYGGYSFKLERKGDDLVVKGELVERLLQIKYSSENIKLQGSAPSDKSLFNIKNKDFLSTGFFKNDLEKALVLKEDKNMSKLKKHYTEVIENPDKAKAKAEAWKKIIYILNNEPILRADKLYDPKNRQKLLSHVKKFIEMSPRDLFMKHKERYLRDEDNRQNKQYFCDYIKRSAESDKVLKNEYHKFQEEESNLSWQKSDNGVDSLMDKGKEPKFKKFTEYLEKRTDKNEIKTQKVDFDNKRVEAMKKLTKIEVYATIKMGKSEKTLIIVGTCK